MKRAEWNIDKGMCVPPCACSAIDENEHDQSTDAFADLRERCPALKGVLVPDSIWHDYQAFCAKGPDEAFHASIAYLAFTRRYIANLTEPIHRFCLDGDRIRPGLTQQYVKDLKEDWIFQPDYKRRFKKCRIFQGRLWELLFACWLHKKGWSIHNLEALGGSTDVCAASPSGKAFAFEVKHIGEDETMFELGVKALGSSGSSFGWPAVYSPVDYLLFRTFEAAKQLSNVPGHKIVALILSDYQRSFRIPLSERWIDWRDPHFLRRDNDIEAFLNKQNARYPNLDSEMRCHIRQIDEIWFFEEGHGLRVKRRRVEKIRD